VKDTDYNIVRRMYLKDPVALRRVLLSDQELVIFNHVKHHGSMDSTRLALIMNLSPTSVTTQMKSVCDKGYFDRKPVADPNRPGRQMYEYTLKNLEDE
jgi:DNA-binding MarR family transcriptional regulator